MTLFLSLGARSLLWGYKRVEIRWGVRGPIRLWTEGPRVTGAPTCAKYLSMCSVGIVRIVGYSNRSGIDPGGRIVRELIVPLLERAHPLL